MNMSRLRKRNSTISSDYVDTGRHHSHSDSDDLDTSSPRAGKWSAEEETFANRLIVEFEAGLLKDCEEGCTLRAYLARRLNCAPMRISKKFAGKCIGKHVFVRLVGNVPHHTAPSHQCLSRLSTTGMSTSSSSPIAAAGHGHGHQNGNQSHKRQRRNPPVHVSLKREAQYVQENEEEEAGDDLDDHWYPTDPLDNAMHGGEEEREEEGSTIIEGLESIVFSGLSTHQLSQTHSQSQWCLNKLLATSSASSSSCTTAPALQYEQQVGDYGGGLAKFDSTASLVCFDEAERRQQPLLHDSLSLSLSSAAHGRTHDSNRMVFEDAVQQLQEDQFGLEVEVREHDRRAEQEEAEEEEGEAEEWTDMLNYMNPHSDPIPRLSSSSSSRGNGRSYREGDGDYCNANALTATIVPPYYYHAGNVSSTHATMMALQQTAMHYYNATTNPSGDRMSYPPHRHHTHQAPSRQGTMQQLSPVSLSARDPHGNVAGDGSSKGGGGEGEMSLSSSAAADILYHSNQQANNGQGDYSLFF